MCCLSMDPNMISIYHFIDGLTENSKPNSNHLLNLKKYLKFCTLNLNVVGLPPYIWRAEGLSPAVAVACVCVLGQDACSQIAPTTASVPYKWVWKSVNVLAHTDA